MFIFYAIIHNFQCFFLHLEKCFKFENVFLWNGYEIKIIFLIEKTFSKNFWMFKTCYHLKKLFTNSKNVQFIIKGSCFKNCFVNLRKYIPI